MEKVENGLYVSVHYRGTLDDGEEFDSSREDRPLEVQMGSGSVISGFEKALDGMRLNEKKTFTLGADEAYGERDESLTQDFARKTLPPDYQPGVGDTVGLTSDQGQRIPATVVHVDDERVTVDMNHPMAGKRLTFEVEVVGISETPTQEAMHCGSGCGCSSESGCDCSSGCSC
jgi:peptidylprolyl isomerase